MLRNLTINLSDVAFGRLQEISVSLPGMRCSVESLVVQAVEEFIARRDKQSEPEKIITDGLLVIAHELSLLGNAGTISDSGMEIGAVENLAMVLKSGLADITAAIENGFSNYHS